MRLLFKQRIFSWFDSYDIYDEAGRTVFTVEGQLSWGHCLHILDAHENHIGTVKERVFTFLPKFEIYEGNEYLGCIQKEFSFFRPQYHIDCMGWEVSGDFMEWDYTITDRNGSRIATISKELLHWSDTYSIDVENPQDSLYVLMLVLAIDAEKCSRD